VSVPIEPPDYRNALPNLSLVKPEEPSRGSGPEIRLLSDAQLEELPEPEPLIEGVLFANTLASLFGGPGAYKSFVALSMATAIAHAGQWCGYSTRVGPVVYVCAEGAGGFSRRIRAWKSAHQVSGSIPLWTVPHSVILSDPTWVSALARKVEETLGAERPQLIVVDTLNRNMLGNENAAEDMSAFVRGCDLLRRRFATTVLVVHHTGHAVDGRGRGHSSWFAALDTEIQCARDGHRVTLTCTKQKDAEEFTPVLLEAVVTAPSLWLRPIRQDDENLTPSERSCLEAVQAAPTTKGVTARQVTEATDGKRSTVYNALSRLEAIKYVRKTMGSYTITAAGQIALRKQSNGRPSENPTPASPESNARGVFNTPALDRLPELDLERGPDDDPTDGYDDDEREGMADA
jgi:hypothetical protein